MAKTKITGKLALQLLEEVVAEKGADYLYPDALCSYEKDGQPSCLVGHVFARAGVPPDLLKMADEVGGMAEEFFESLFLSDWPVTGTRKAERILAAAQQAQDGALIGPAGRKTWGEALEEARRVK